jgi:hypothetical protein
MLRVERSAVLGCKLGKGSIADFSAFLVVRNKPNACVILESKEAIFSFW